MGCKTSKRDEEGLIVRPSIMPVPTGTKKTSNVNTYKILVIGDANVGKSSMLLRYVDNTFSDSFIVTIGVDSKTKDIKLEGADVKISVWDTAGQERFRTITSSYYRGAHGIMVVYDVTNRDSFQNVKKWQLEANRYVTDTHSTIIVGNKCDRGGERKVSFEEGKELADELEVDFFETSAKDSTQIEEAFDSLARKIKNELERYL